MLSKVMLTCVMLIAAAAIAQAAPKEKKAKPTQITCEEFLALGEDVRPHVVYWIDGFSKSGKLEDDVIEFDTFERPIAVIVEECQKTPKETLWEKVKKHS